MTAITQLWRVQGDVVQGVVVRCSGLKREVNCNRGLVRIKWCCTVREVCIGCSILILFKWQDWYWYTFPGWGPDPNFCLIRLSRPKLSLIRISRRKLSLIRLSRPKIPQTQRVSDHTFQTEGALIRPSSDHGPDSNSDHCPDLNQTDQIQVRSKTLWSDSSALEIVWS